MGFPFLRRDGAALECREIGLDIRCKHIEAAHDALQVQQEVRAFVVRNRRERIVRIFTIAELGHEALEPRRVLKALEGVTQGLGADNVRKATVRWPIQLLEEQTLQVHSPALVQPERFPVHARNQIAAP